MSYSLAFELQGLPKMPNSLLGSHWRARAGHAQEWHRKMWRCAWHLKPEKPLERAVVTFTRYSSREPDFDGLAGSFKAVADGLVKCGIIVDDRPSCIGQPTYLWEKCAPKKGHVKIKVEGVA